RSNCRGILAANHQHVVVIIGMRLAIVVENFRQLFPGNIHVIRQVVISSGDYELSCLIQRPSVMLVDSMYPKLTIGAFDPLHPVVLPDIELIVHSYLAVILKGLHARWFGVNAREWNVADFKQL